MKFKAKNFDELTTAELYEILKARAEIFIMEQNINYQDMDNIDYRSRHFFLEENNKVIAYLRAFYKNNDKNTVQLGRVLTLTHGNGFGKILLERSIAEIKEYFNCEKIYIDSQIHAVGFYEKFGFHITSDEFLEEGIVHVSMELKLI